MSLTEAKLRALAAVIEHKTFARAARAMGVTVPTISQSIRDLEREQEVILFRREDGAYVPTSVACALYPLAVDMRLAREKAQDILQRHRTTESGNLRIGLGNASPGMAVIRRFLDAVPTANVWIETGSYAHIMTLMQRQQIDVALLPNVPHDPEFEKQVVLEQRVVAIAPQDSSFAPLGTATCNDLMNAPLIFRTQGSSTQNHVDRAFRVAGLTPRPSILANNRESVAEAVKQRLGIGFVWETATLRIEGIRKIYVEEMETKVPEHVFKLASNTTPLTNIFMDMAVTDDL